MNKVDWLLENPFNTLSEQDKIHVKNLGAHHPLISIIQKHRTQSRSFNKDWYLRKPWLTASESKKTLFCFDCLVFGGDLSWTRHGVKDLKHLSERIRSHERTARHIGNSVKLNLFGTEELVCTQLDEGFSLATEEHSFSMNKDSLSRVDVTPSNHDELSSHAVKMEIPTLEEMPISQDQLSSLSLQMGSPTIFGIQSLQTQVPTSQPVRMTSRLEGLPYTHNIFPSSQPTLSQSGLLGMPYTQSLFPPSHSQMPCISTSPTTTSEDRIQDSSLKEKKLNFMVKTLSKTVEALRRKLKISRKSTIRSTGKNENVYGKKTMHSITNNGTNSFGKGDQYYQLWMEKNKENWLLSSQISDSKQIVTELEQKLTGFENSIKDLKACLELNKNEKQVGSRFESADSIDTSHKAYSDVEVVEVTETQLEDLPDKIPLSECSSFPGSTGSESKFLYSVTNRSYVEPEIILQERPQEIAVKPNPLRAGSKKSYKCSTCDKRFFCQNKFQRHTRIHTGEKPFRCKICGKRFVNSSLLVKHELCHTTDQNSHVCKLCHNYFWLADDLAKHSCIFLNNLNHNADAAPSDSSVIEIEQEARGLLPDELEHQFILPDGSIKQNRLFLQQKDIKIEPPETSFEVLNKNCSTQGVVMLEPPSTSFNQQVERRHVRSKLEAILTSDRTTLAEIASENRHRRESIVKVEEDGSSLIWTENPNSVVRTPDSFSRECKIVSS